MRYIILTRFHSQHSQGEFVMRLAAAAAAAGDTLTIINPSDLMLDFSGGVVSQAGGSLPECPVRYRDLPFPAADLIIPLARWDDDFTWQVAETLQAWGEPVFPPNRVPLGDHVTMARLFARKGVPTPRSWVLNSADQLTVILPELTFPCILRSRHGGKGRNLSVAQHSGEAMELAQRYANVGYPFVVQDLAQPWGEDIRALVIGDQVIAAVQRFAPPGFVRPREAGNLRCQLIELTDDERKIILTASQIYGAPFCTVNILRSSQGTLLLEVARAPVLSELEAVIGGNLSALIVAHLQTLAKQYGPGGKVISIQRHTAAE